MTSQGKRAFRRAGALLVVFSSLVACGGSTPSLETLGGESALPWWQRFALDRAIDYRVAMGERSGYVAVIAKNGAPVYARTSGWADIEAQTPMALDTRFHLASMTKPITAVAAMILVEEGRLSLDDLVEQYVPTFRAPQVATSRSDEDFTSGPSSTPLRVRHLLTFTSGIGGYEEKGDALDRAWRAQNIEPGGLGNLAQRIERMRGLPLYEEPGTRWRYGWSLDVLARIVEVAAGEPYDAFVQRRIFDPLGMTRTGYPSTQTPDATLYTHEPDGSLVRETEFGEYGEGWTPGGGGLVSTAADYTRFALMLLGGGALGDVRILREDTVAEMTRVHVRDGILEGAETDGLEGLGFGLGVSVVADAEHVIMPGTEGDYWWSGLFGTHFWISPAEASVVVVMQATHRNEHSGLPITPVVVQGIALF